VLSQKRQTEKPIFIDENIKANRREYHYQIAYPSNQKAVEIIYKKHLLVGNEHMDALWEIEKALK